MFSSSDRREGFPWLRLEAPLAGDGGWVKGGADCKIMNWNDAILSSRLVEPKLSGLLRDRPRSETG